MSVREATKENFHELIQENVVVVEFFSDSCLPCQLMSKVLENVALDMPFVSVLKVNSSKYATLGRSFRVTAFPTILFFKNGVEVHRYIGFMSAQNIEAMITLLNCHCGLWPRRTVRSIECENTK